MSEPSVGRVLCDLGNTTNSIDPGCLTVDKLREMQRLLDQITKDMPQAEHFDLYGHDLPNLEKCYILDPLKVHEQMYGKGPLGRLSWLGKILAGAERDRKMLIVPRVRLEEIYFQLRALGLDVRLEPRYGAQPAGEEKGA